MFRFLKSLLAVETTPAPLPFDIEQERARRRSAVVAAEKEMTEAADALRKFQGESYCLNDRLQLVPRVNNSTAGEVVSNLQVDLQHQLLVRELSRAHDSFTSALQSWSELQP